jgi:hypothetical protein
MYDPYAVSLVSLYKITSSKKFEDTIWVIRIRKSKNR